MKAQRGIEVSTTLSLNLALYPQEKTRYPLYRRLGWPQGQSGGMPKCLPLPGSDPRTIQTAASHYTDWAVPDLFKVNPVPNFTVRWTAMLLRLLKFPSSNLGPKIVCPIWAFPQFHPTNIQTLPQTGRDQFNSHSFLCIIHVQSYHSLSCL